MIKEPFTNLPLINEKTGILDNAKSQSIKAKDILLIFSLIKLSVKDFSKNPFIILHLPLLFFSIFFTSS